MVAGPFYPQGLVGAATKCTHQGRRAVAAWCGASSRTAPCRPSMACRSLRPPKRGLARGSRRPPHRPERRCAVTLGSSAYQVVWVRKVSWPGVNHCWTVTVRFLASRFGGGGQGAASPKGEFSVGGRVGAPSSRVPKRDANGAREDSEVATTGWADPHLCGRWS